MSNRARPLSLPSARSSPDPPATFRRPHGRAVLALLSTAQFMIVLDGSIVVVALPAIQSRLAFSPTAVPWVMNAYILMFAGFMLLSGRLADGLGHRRIFLAGVGTFSAASLLCGLAPSAGALIAARVVQGLGGAMTVPAALSLLAITFPQGHERTRALGVWGAVAAGGGAAGVVLGGLITTALSWPWIFVLNVPVGAVVVGLAPWLLPAGRAQHPRRRLDVAGALTVTAGLALFVYALVTSADQGWTSLRTLGCLSASALLLCGFVVIERRVGEPLVPPRAFRQRQVAAANAVGLLFGTSLTAVFLVLSLYMQHVLGYTPLVTGLAILVTTLALIGTSARVHRLVNRHGVVRVLAAGLVLSVLARLWFARADVDGTYLLTLVPGLLLMGVGMGLSFVPIMVTAIGGTTEEYAGIAAGLLATCQQVGGALGVAVLSAVAIARTGAVIRGHRHEPSIHVRALVDGYDAAFLVGALLAAAALLLRPAIRRSAPPPAPAHPHLVHAIDADG